MITKQISRRTVLRGMGVMMGLPFLDAMTPRPRLHAAATPALPVSVKPSPVRLAVLYMPNGVNPHTWTPNGRGHDFELSSALTPLAGLKDQILVLTELWNAATDTGDGHYVKTGGFLTGTTITRTTGSDLRSGNVSMDQVAAQRIGHLTPLPSLELGIEPVTTGVDINVGFTRLYGSHISWSSPTTPLAKEIHPQMAFDRLFRSGHGGARMAGTQDRSILDLVADDARRLRRQVGADDRRKLDEYFESVRSVERRIDFENRRRAEQVRTDPLALAEIERVGRRIRDWSQDPARVSERSIDHTEHVRLMLDIIALAFWTDSTRVSTFMFGNAVSGKNFSFIEGVSGGHHQISHHENKPAALEEYRKINAWHVAQYAYLLERLRSIREGESTLLDQCMILFGAGLRDGNAHSPRNLPLVLGGRGGGTIAPGRHLIYETNSPLTNLYVALLNRLGTPVARFADSTGELPGLSEPGFAGNAV